MQWCSHRYITLARGNNPLLMLRQETAVNTVGHTHKRRHGRWRGLVEKESFSKRGRRMKEGNRRDEND